MRRTGIRFPIAQRCGVDNGELIAADVFPWVTG